MAQECAYSCVYPTCLQPQPVTPMLQLSSDTNNFIGQRLKLEMKRREISSTELARRAGVKTSFLYDIISGKSANPSTVKLGRVAEVLGINLSYLVGSVSNPESGASVLRQADEYCTLARIMVDVSASGSTIISQEYEQERYHFRRSWIEGQLGVSPSDLRLLSVRGDSMEPTLCHNDTVMIDTTKQSPSPPGMFVLFDGFGLVAKRMERTGDSDAPRVRIISDNPQYTTYERSIDEIFVIGRVVWFGREI